MVRSDAKAFDWRRYWCLFVVVSIPSGHICRHMCVFRLCFSVVSAVRLFGMGNWGVLLSSNVV